MEAEIWRQLLARGYKRKENDRTKVEVVSLGMDQDDLFQVRFHYTDENIPDLQGKYEEILVMIARLPLRRPF